MAHVYGSAYEMGYAHGQLLNESVRYMQKEVIAYLESQVASALPKSWPAWLANIVATLGMDSALDYLIAATKV